MKKVLFVLPAVAIAAVGFTPIAQAAPIVLSSSNPDVYVDNGVAVLTVSGSTRVLTLTGTTEHVTTTGNVVQDFSPLGSFTAVIDLSLVGSVTGQNEQFTITGGSLNVTGNSTTLWSAGTPTEFGFSNTAGATAPADFEIQYTAPTGSFSNGKAVNVIYHSEGAIANYGLNFLDVAFSTNAIIGAGQADVLAPEPTSIALLTLAAPMLMRRRRKA